MLDIEPDLLTLSGPQTGSRSPAFATAAFTVGLPFFTQLLIESGDAPNFLAAADIPPRPFSELIWFTNSITRLLTASE